MNRLPSGLMALGVVLLAGTARADVVTEWSDTYLQVIRATGGAPCPLSRDGPMLYLSMYDAINAIDTVNNPNAAFTPYQQGLPVPAADTSREAAAAAAAYTSLTALHLNNATDLALIQARYDSQLAAIPDGPAKTNGIAFGTGVANTLLAQRQNDGYDADSSYTPGGHAGDWRVTPDGPVVQPFTPHWGNVTPWGLLSGSQFRPTRMTDFGSMDNLMHSQAYADQINGTNGVLGVKDFGARNSQVRTAEQTEIAWFWANDRDGTSKPPGQLIQITQAVSANTGLSLSQNARLYGMVGLALGDACIAAWDSKYNTPIDLWRPIDAIRETLDDGNAATTPDPNWLPLNDFTPPFPAYVSGHATFGATHAAVMAAFFGTDSMTFTIGSDEFAVNPGLGYPADLTRTFHSFSEAAMENALSRVYLGVHYEWDALDGNTLGYQVGNYIASHYMLPIPGPGATSGLVLAGAVGLSRRRRA